MKIPCHPERIWITLTRDSELLDATFDPRANALNAVRLTLAVAVIWWHSFPLTGHVVATRPLHQALSEMPVDGFFAVSGFLIVGSWRRDQSWRRFLTSRVLRIFPAFWVCLGVTALALAPLLAEASGHPVHWRSNLAYLTHNVGLKINQYGILGTLQQVPYPGVWDGSLWTLWWEFLCYLGVLVMGVTRLTSTRWAIPTAFVLAVAGLGLTAYGPVGNFYVTNGSRFGVMFLAGAVIQRAGNRIPMSWSLVATAATVAAAATVLPDYRILGALPLAYSVVGVGILVKAPRFRLRNDISYGTYIYAFPVQQILATAGAARLHVGAFGLAATAATLPVAAASWFLIEKPALRLKPRR